MNDETVSTEATDSVPDESVPVDGEAGGSEAADGSVTESTEAVVVIDYTPVLLDCTTTLSNIILSGALMIVGVLCAFKLWEVKIK